MMFSLQVHNQRIRYYNDEIGYRKMWSKQRGRIRLSFFLWIMIILVPAVVSSSSLIHTQFSLSSTRQIDDVVVDVLSIRSRSSGRSKKEQSRPLHYPSPQHPKQQLPHHQEHNEPKVATNVMIESIKPRFGTESSAVSTTSPRTQIESLPLSQRKRNFSSWSFGLSSFMSLTTTSSPKRRSYPIRSTLLINMPRGGGGANTHTIHRVAKSSSGSECDDIRDKPSSISKIWRRWSVANNKLRKYQKSKKTADDQATDAVPGITLSSVATTTASDEKKKTIIPTVKNRDQYHGHVNRNHTVTSECSRGNTMTSATENNSIETITTPPTTTTIKSRIVIPTEHHLRQLKDKTSSLANYPDVDIDENDDHEMTMMKTVTVPIVMVIDGGTESIRVGCFHALTGELVGRTCAASYPTRHPHPGWAEQDPNDWYRNLGIAAKDAIQSVLLSKSSTLSISNDKDEMINDDYEMMLNNNNNVSDIMVQYDYVICGICFDTTCCSVVLMNRTNGEALYPCLLWMDQRSSKQSVYIAKVAHDNPALKINCDGNGPVSSEWLLCKALWLRDNIDPVVWNDPNTVLCEYQDYMNYHVTGGKVFVASSCNAITRWHWNGTEIGSSPTMNHADYTSFNSYSSENDHNNNDTINSYNKNAKDDLSVLYTGRPISLYEQLGISELLYKLPKHCVPMGSVIGNLSVDTAKHMGIITVDNEEDEQHHISIPIIQGGPDAFVGMIGLGCIEDNQFCLITGSSHLHCLVTSQDRTSRTMWGTYVNAPITGINFVEGGQSSTGSVLRWFKNNILLQPNISYAELDELVIKNSIPPCCNGLICLDTFQGSRTPFTDPFARGAFIGLTLQHNYLHMYRSILESVCYGTRTCIEGLLQESDTNDDDDEHNHSREIIIAGGVTRSPLWLQMHADVTNRTLIICENSDNAPLVGCAILASYGIGLYPTIQDAVKCMVRISSIIKPIPENVRIYDTFYRHVYRNMSSSIRPISHALHHHHDQLQQHPTKQPQDNDNTAEEYSICDNDDGGSKNSSSSLPSKTDLKSVVTSLRGGDAVDCSIDDHDRHTNDHRDDRSIDDHIECDFGLRHVVRRRCIISPSLLACDWMNMKNEILQCLQVQQQPLDDHYIDDNGNINNVSSDTSSHDIGDATMKLKRTYLIYQRFHVDVFDGVYLDSPYAFTFGPLMIRAIHDATRQMVSQIKRKMLFHHDIKEGDTDDSKMVIDIDVDDFMCTVEFDVHLCADRPERYVDAIASSGGTRFIFQYEYYGPHRMKEMHELIEKIQRTTNMKCGISINPQTSIEEIYPLLETGCIDVVNLLAVEPGFGGQSFRKNDTIPKIKKLKQYRDNILSKLTSSSTTETAPTAMSNSQKITTIVRRKRSSLFDIIVDGGVNNETISEIVEAGADIVVSGSYLFQHENGIRAAFEALWQKMYPLLHT